MSDNIKVCETSLHPLSLFKVVKTTDNLHNGLLRRPNLRCGHILAFYKNPEGNLIEDSHHVCQTKSHCNRNTSKLPILCGHYPLL